MKPEKIKELLGDLVEEVETVSERRLSTTADLEKYKDALLELRGTGIQHLTAITGIDLGEEIEVIYHVECRDGTLLNLRTRVSKDQMALPTVTDIFPGAILYERELMEMLGVKVTDHPDPRRLFLPEDWPEDRHPLLKGQFNYQKIVEQTISEIKEASKKRDFDYEMLLEVEKKNKNRKSLKKWLEKQIKKLGSEK